MKLSWTILSNFPKDHLNAVKGWIKKWCECCFLCVHIFNIFSFEHTANVKTGLSNIDGNLFECYLYERKEIYFPVSLKSLF